MDIRKQFGLIVRQARLSKGLTQEELAYRADMSVPYLSGIERGRNSPSLVMLADLSVALDTSLAELFQGVSLDAGEIRTGRRRSKDT